MLKQSLYLHWKAARWGILLMVFLCFGLPLMVGRLAQMALDDMRMDPTGVLNVVEGIMPMFPILAILTGITVALTSWSWDHEVKHIYALSLPVPRRNYVLIKLGAGAILLLIPVLALLIGSLLATLPLGLPTSIHAYPASFTMRFLLASLLIYAAVFAAAAGTKRTTVILALGLTVFLVGGTIVVGSLEKYLARNLTDPIELLNAALLYWPGPFHVFGGNWMLIDV